MKVAYVTNLYPSVSHSFIRREIAGLEANGVAIERFSIRPCGEDLVDPEDKKERTHTRVILSVGLLGLLMSLLRTALRRPVQLARAIGLALRIGWRSDRGAARHLAYVAEACVLLREVKESAAQHVHAHFGTNSAAVAMLCHALGGPRYSFTVHGSSDIDKAYAIGLTQKIERAAFVVAASDFGRSQLYRWCRHEHWARIHVVRCGLDDKFLKAPETPIPSSPRLVCVGRLSAEKGHLLLVAAAGQLVAEGIEVELALVGDGPLRPEIEGVIASIGLGGCVRITGWASSSEVKDQILGSRALVLPSLYEGLPVVVMEALALGRPVIGTYVAGVPELIEPGTCGWLVPAGSVDALAAAMRHALQAPTRQLAQMGRAGAARVAQMHNAAVQAGKLAGLFEAAIRNRDQCSAFRHAAKPSSTILHATDGKYHEERDTSDRADHSSGRYVLISPARDEAGFLQMTIDSVVSQTVPPVKWVIVDDGSTDETAEIADRAAAQHPWIEVIHRADRGRRAVGPGVVEAFYDGYDKLSGLEYDYLCKMDGDLSFGGRYFEHLLGVFERNPRLGAASGKCFHPVGGRLFEERIDDESVLGAMKFYRKECFEQIGGLLREVMWDGIDFHRARIAGWQTRSLRDPELRIIHHRRMGSSHRSVIHGRLRWGRGQYFMGTHPLYILASGINRTRERPFVIGGLSIIVGYVSAWLRREPKYNDQEFRRELRKWQLRRIHLGR